MKKKKDDIQHNASMFRGAPISSFKKARSLREKPTEAEGVFWDIVKNKQFHGLKFRREHPILIYIADFYCHQLKLIIELDGGYHETPNQKEKDRIRTADLEALGITVMRFSNDEILTDLNKVLDTLEKLISNLKNNEL